MFVTNSQNLTRNDVNDQSYHFLHSIKCTQNVTKHHLHYFLRFLSPAMIFCLIFTSLISFSVKTSLNLITLEEIFGWLCIVTLTNLNSYMHVIYISLLYNTCTYMYIFYTLQLLIRNFWLPFQF